MISEILTGYNYEIDQNRIFITLENNSLDHCYELSSKIEGLGYKMSAWLRTNDKIVLIMSKLYSDNAPQHKEVAQFH